MMPGMDGIEAVRIIRSEIGSDYAKQVPVIALTANAIVGNEEMFLKNGFQAFLSKPIDMVKLDQILNEWVWDEKKEALITEITEMAEFASPPSGEKNIFLAVMHIPGLNAVTGLTHFDNDEKSYLLVLRSFVAHAPDYVKNIKTFLEAGAHEQDLDSYRVAVHSLKGMCRNAGAGELGDMAEGLEIATMEQDIDTIKADTGEFVEAVEKLIADVALFLQTLPKEP